MFKIYFKDLELKAIEPQAAKREIVKIDISVSSTEIKRILIGEEIEIEKEFESHNGIITKIELLERGELNKLRLTIKIV